MERGEGRILPGSVQLLTCTTGLHIRGTLWNSPRTEIFIFISWSPSHFSLNVILSKQHHHLPGYSDQNPGKPSWSLFFHLPPPIYHQTLWALPSTYSCPTCFSTVPVAASVLDGHLVSTAEILLVPSVHPALPRPPLLWLAQHPQVDNSSYLNWINAEAGGEGDDRG